MYKKPLPTLPSTALSNAATFEEAIRQMNSAYLLGVAPAPMLYDRDGETPLSRLRKFRKVIQDELNEVDDIIATVERSPEEQNYSPEALAILPSITVEPIETLTNLADLLGDLIVYIWSEATRWGIPIEDVLSIIMQSNFSKMGVDGKPIMSEDRSKFLKGPNYWKPEPFIRELLEARRAEYEKTREEENAPPEVRLTRLYTLTQDVHPFQNSDEWTSRLRKFEDALREVRASPTYRALYGDEDSKAS